MDMFNSGHIAMAVNINAFSDEAPNRSEKYLTKKKLFAWKINV